MSIQITSTAEWFRCIGRTATLQERQAALAKLVRLLVGDTTRPRPPISLPGRLALPVAPPPAIALSPTPTLRYWRRAVPTGKAITRPSSDADAREPYSREQLERMDTRFIERLERAIAHGKERPPCSTF
jgi:hypothetical protein